MSKRRSGHYSIKSACLSLTEKYLVIIRTCYRDRYRGVPSAFPTVWRVQLTVADDITYVSRWLEMLFVNQLHVTFYLIENGEYFISYLNFSSCLVFVSVGGLNNFSPT